MKTIFKIVAHLLGGSKLGGVEANKQDKLNLFVFSNKKKTTSALLPKISTAGQTESELRVTQSVFVHPYNSNVYNQGIYQLQFLKSTPEVRE